MGGSGGGDGPISARPGQSEPSDEDICRSLRFTTNLEPVSGPIHELGAVLTVVPTEVGAGTVFVAIDNDRQPVGTIIERTDDLLLVHNSRDLI